MPSDAVPSRTTVATILGRALGRKGGDVPPEGARFILDLGIREEDQQRTLDLLARRRESRITTEEEEELASYVQADTLLSLLKAKALLALKDAGQRP